ncbi:PmoA family protein [Leifsonia poae]|uniref:DUF6807 domain-containing protein n=1 Tax=Leifsonia poae TaxID=110933 RepID=UPI003D66A124
MTIAEGEWSEGSGFDLRLGTGPVGRYVASPRTEPDQSPRPYVHPLRTVGGIDVTDFRPADHRWHHGLSLAVPSVGPSNLWGGGSWDRAAGGYVDRHDHGSIRTDSATADALDGRISSHLSWLDAEGLTVADEERTLNVAEAGGGWTLDWTSHVRSLTDLRLGSPGAYGRVGAGYGGLFLRAAPAFRGSRARTDRSSLVPADDLLGVTARWLALTRPDGAATVVLGTPQDATWFVRSEEYPGFGPAPFFSRETVLAPGEHLEFAVRLWVVDGEPSSREIEYVVAG